VRNPHPQADPDLASKLPGALVEADQLQGSRTFFVAIVLMAPTKIQVNRAGFTAMR
jgi:hypothetical protein